MILTENGLSVYLVKNKKGIYEDAESLEYYNILQEPIRRKFREMQDAKNNKSS